MKSSLHREIPIRPDVDAMRWETLSPLNSSTHLRLRLKIPIKGSLEAFLQDPLITIRVTIFASWRKNLLVQRLLLRANTLALAFMWIMAPISAILQGLDVWLILLSWGFDTGLSRRRFGLCLEWLDLLQSGLYLLWLLEDFLSSTPSPASPWSCTLGHWSFLSLFSLTECPGDGYYSLTSRIYRIFWTACWVSWFHPLSRIFILYRICGPDVWRTSFSSPV